MVSTGVEQETEAPVAAMVTMEVAVTRNVKVVLIRR